MNTCETCAAWRPPVSSRHQPAFGVCKSDDVRLNIFTGDWDGWGQQPYLETQASFGCVAWLAK